MSNQPEHDTGFEYLLSLHGVIQVQSEEGHWVKFEVWQAPLSELRPHGLKYSLTLHAPDGTRLMGFDNAHPVEPRRSFSDRDTPCDHLHRHTGHRGECYEFVTAYQLLQDFYREVDRILKGRPA